MWALRLRCSRKRILIYHHPEDSLHVSNRKRWYHSPSCLQQMIRFYRTLHYQHRWLKSYLQWDYQTCPNDKLMLRKGHHPCISKLCDWHWSRCLHHRLHQYLPGITGLHHGIVCEFRELTYYLHHHWNRNRLSLHLQHFQNCLSQIDKFQFHHQPH